MPSTDDNYLVWNVRYSWKRHGEEWSDPWGSSVAEWENVILPRLEGMIPVQTILEIAPGFGRWTEYLRWSCDHLIAVDLSPRCIEACKRRFTGDSRVTLAINNGRSLEMIADSTVDTVFSFDSLVHAEPDVIGDYLKEIVRVLRKDGTGFIHHSNLGQYSDQLRAERSRDEQWRSRNMSARVFRSLCEDSGLVCTKQELVDWNSTGRLLDCFSWVSGSRTATSLLSPLENWKIV